MRLQLILDVYVDDDAWATEYGLERTSDAVSGDVLQAVPAQLLESAQERAKLMGTYRVSLGEVTELRTARPSRRSGLLPEPAERTWTFCGHWDEDRLLVDYVLDGEQEDVREDPHGVFEQGLWAASGTGTDVDAVRAQVVGRYQYDLTGELWVCGDCYTAVSGGPYGPTCEDECAQPLDHDGPCSNDVLEVGAHCQRCGRRDRLTHIDQADYDEPLLPA